MKHLFLAFVLFVFVFSALGAQNAQSVISQSTTSYTQKDNTSILSSLIKDTKSFVKGVFGNSQNKNSSMVNTGESCGEQNGTTTDLGCGRYIYTWTSCDTGTTIVEGDVGHLPPCTQLVRPKGKY